jgi:hypothetical protein
VRGTEIVQCLTCRKAFRARLSCCRLYCSKRCYGQSRSTEEVIVNLICAADDNCLRVGGTITTHGYRQFSFGKKIILAHRYAYEIVNGKIPDNHHVHHKCRTRDCYNPKHLQALTPAEHLLKGDTVVVRNIAKTHCIRGHSFDNTNTGYQRDGSRACLACRRIFNREVARKRREGIYR